MHDSTGTRAIAYDIRMDQPENSQPTIARQDRDTNWPKISVVVPVYEPGPYLIDAINSVLSQDTGPAEMQVAVVDDSSPTCQVQALIDELLPPGRVEFYRNTENRGLSGNWNECLRIARGEIIHLLHQDDRVAPGFYSRMLPAFAADSRIGMAFCRHAFIDGEDRITRISHRERWLTGPLPDWLPKIAVQQRIQCASALVRRSVYEQLGGYRSDLRYALDWEMWVRIAAQYGVWYEPRLLAYYRRHEHNESARLRNDDLINCDLLKAIELIAERVPVTQRTQLSDKAYAHFAHRALKRLESQVNGSKGVAKDITKQLAPVITAVARISANATRLQRRVSRLEDSKCKPRSRT